MGDHSNARTVDWLLRGYFAVAAVRSLGLVLTYVDAADPSSPEHTVVAWVAPIHVWAALLAGIGLLLVGAAWRPGRFYGRAVLVLSFALNFVLGLMIAFTWEWVPMFVMFIVAAVLDAMFAVIPYVPTTVITSIRRGRLPLP